MTKLTNWFFSVLIVLPVSLPVYAADDSLSQYVTPQFELSSKMAKPFLKAGLAFSPKIKNKRPIVITPTVQYSLSKDDEPVAKINDEIENWRVGLEIGYNFYAVTIPPASDVLDGSGTVSDDAAKQHEKALFFKWGMDYGTDKLSYYNGFFTDTQSHKRMHVFSTFITFQYLSSSQQFYPQFRIKYNTGYQEAEKQGIVVESNDDTPSMVRTGRFAKPGKTKGFHIRLFMPFVPGKAPLDIGPALIYAPSALRGDWQQEAQAELWFRYHPGKIKGSIGISPYYQFNFSDRNMAGGVLVKLHFGKTYDY